MTWRRTSTRIVLLSMLAALAFTSNAGADLHDPGRCVGDGNPDPMSFACHKTFTATNEAQSWRYKGAPNYLAYTFLLANDDFTDGDYASPKSCNSFARKGDLRIRLTFCQHLIVRYRSVGEPLTFDLYLEAWE